MVDEVDGERTHEVLFFRIAQVFDGALSIHPGQHEHGEQDGTAGFDFIGVLRIGQTVSLPCGGEHFGEAGFTGEVVKRLEEEMVEKAPRLHLGEEIIEKGVAVYFFWLIY